MTALLPRVALITLGGTIASIPRGDGGATPALDAAAIAAAAPGITDIASLELVSFRKLPGAHLTSADLVELAKLVEDLAASGMVGIVVTQGTDTIEETAFALDMLAGSRIPVVVTGAMRGPTEPGADGPANILNAVRVAASGATAGMGVTVILDDTLHAARWVQKRHTSRPSAFASPDTGPIGWIAEGQVKIAAEPRRGLVIKNVNAGKMARVALLSTWIGDDGQLVAQAAALYDGLVVQGMGGGHVNRAVAEAITVAAKHIPVIFSSRVSAGTTLRRTYGFVGSELDLIARGAIPSGSLDATKARLLLELLLSRDALTPADALADFRAFDAI